MNSIDYKVKFYPYVDSESFHLYLVFYDTSHILFIVNLATFFIFKINFPAFFFCYYSEDSYIVELRSFVDSESILFLEGLGDTKINQFDFLFIVFHIVGDSTSNSSTFFDSILAIFLVEIPRVWSLAYYSIGFKTTFSGVIFLVGHQALYYSWLICIYIAQIGECFMGEPIFGVLFLVKLGNYFVLSFGLTCLNESALHVGLKDFKFAICCFWIIICLRLLRLT